VPNYDEVVPPGGEGKINVEIYTKRKKGKGTIQLKVITDDPKNKITMLRVLIDIKRLLFMSKEFFYLTVPDDKATTYAVTVTSDIGKALSLKGEPVNMKDFATYKIEEIETGQKYKIHISSIPGAALGKHSGHLKLITNYPDKPELNLKFIIHVKTKEEYDRWSSGGARRKNIKKFKKSK
jgi:hypothetical protein